MIALSLQSVLAATGYSLPYLLGSGVLLGAIVIFVVPRMFRK